MAQTIERNPAEPLAASDAGNGSQFLDSAGKDQRLVVLGDPPLVAQTPEHLLDDDTTPTEKFFIRNNGTLPGRVDKPDAWTIRIDGSVNSPLELRVGDIKQRFQARTHRMVLECGGNGRAFFKPPARGNPLAKSLDDYTMIVWAMNGQPLTTIHGGPARLLVPGWPGSLSTKWLTRIQVRETPHDGEGMGGTSYRVPVTPIVPGSDDDGKSFRDLEALPMRSIITSPAH
jgi:sulfite oxidase